MAVANDEHSIGAGDSGLTSPLYPDGGSSEMVPPQKVRAVAFKDDPPEVREVRIEEYEVQERWYSNEEYFFIKKEALRVLRRVSRSNIEDTNAITTRGLEIVDDKQVKQRKQAIDSVVKCILEAQQISGSNPEHLSPLYQEMTQECVRKSLDNANSDAKDAEVYLADTKKELNTETKIRRTRLRMFQSLYRRFSNKQGAS